MTNFEKLKNEIDIKDFAEKRICYDENNVALFNDVGTYKIPKDCTDEQADSINEQVYNEELAWLKSEAKDDY